MCARSTSETPVGTVRHSQRDLGTQIDQRFRRSEFHASSGDFWGREAKSGEPKTSPDLVVEEALCVLVLELLKELVDDLPEHRLLALGDQALLERDLVDDNLQTRS